MIEEQNQKETIDLSDALHRQSGGLKTGPSIFHGVCSGTPKIIQWMIAHSGSIIKNEKQASYVIFGFFILATVISILLFSSGGGSVKVEVPPLVNPPMP